MTVTRPVLRYHGGKWLLAPWIIQHFPAHRVYVEPFGGAASVLLRKPRSYAEVYNDLDGEIVNLFRVLRDPAQARELVRLVRLTPYARIEFELSYITADDPIEQARRTLFRSFAGHGSTLTGKWPTGFRNNVTRSGTIPATDWRNLPEPLEAIVERMAGVVVENRPAADLIRTYDGERTLFYIDPPYPADTRNARWARRAYRHEMTDDDHRELAHLVRPLRGMVVISGYACDLYDQELYAGWERVTHHTHADSALDRTEVLWISPGTRRGQERLQGV
jgi:DNA adenine methylase